MPDDKGSALSSFTPEDIDRLIQKPLQAIIACAKENTSAASQAVTLLLAAAMLLAHEFNVDATLASAMCEAIVERVVLKVTRGEEPRPS